MKTLAHEWTFSRAAVTELQSYLLSKELYWQVSPLKEDRPAGRLPSLTPGNLLLSMRKLGAMDWSGDQRESFRILEKQFAALKAQWRSAWLLKAGRELPARLKLWQDYLDESTHEDGRLVDYPFKARWRAIVDLLAEDGLEIEQPYDQLIQVLDKRLENLTMEAQFVWEKGSERGFPLDRFWYLYRVQRRK